MEDEEKKDENKKKVDPHKRFEKLNKISKKFLGVGTAFGVFSAVLLIMVCVLSIAGVFSLPSDTPRVYECEFQDYTGLRIYYRTYKRGEEISYTTLDTYRPNDPDGTSYSFYGWDISGDSIPDVLPTRMYYSFVAVPLYHSKTPKKPKTNDFNLEVVDYASK